MLSFVSLVVLFSLVLQYSTSVSGNVVEQRAHQHHTRPTVTHHHGHHTPTAEPDILFKYDGHSMSVMASDSRSNACYLYVLKISEFHLMEHTDGVKQIESHMESMIQSNNSTLLAVTYQDIVHEFHGVDFHHCHIDSKFYIIK